jgi:CheY-like chemotaxis protein
MTTPFLTPPLSSPLPRPTKAKRVLLLDTSTAKRELRAEAMRKLGISVDCACDIDEARSWWRPGLYDLVLVNSDNEVERRDKFCDDVRAAVPPQQLAFLVGKPVYLANLPAADGVSSPGPGIDLKFDEHQKNVPPLDMNDNSPLPWGIMAASRRISQVRSVAAARATAMRSRPTPPRDLEVRESRRADVSELALALRKEGLL